MRLIIIILLSALFNGTGFSQTGWIVQPMNINRAMTDVYFINQNTGWSVGDTSGVFKTTNGGMNWVRQDLGYTGISLTAVRFINENTGFAAGHDHFVYMLESAYFFRTTNGGANWSRTYASGGYVYFRSIFPINDTLVYASLGGTSGYDQIGAIYITTNGGYNFTSLKGLGTSHSLYFLNANTGWVCSFYSSDFGNSSGAIFKTTNGGINWTQQYQDTLTNSTQFYKIQFLDNNTGYALGKSGTSSRFLATTNGGVNWSSTIYTHGKYRSMFFINPNTGWIGGSCYPDSSCISYTTNAGQSWSLQKKYLGDLVYSIHFTNSLTGWAAMSTSNLMHTNTGGVVNVSSNYNEMPASYILEQNYPNPFNPNTEILFGLPKAGKVRLSVYSVEGREVMLITERTLKLGSYTEKFRGENMSSGIYFCVMSVDGVVTRMIKMALVK